jgi:hypothetical protein
MGGAAKVRNPPFLPGEGIDVTGPHRTFMPRVAKVGLEPKLTPVRDL